MKNNKEHTEACDATKLCCCHNILLNQSDFLEQSTALEEILEERGHICWMLPKMHPKLNPIDSYWGAMKVFLGHNCDYSLKGLRQFFLQQLQEFWLQAPDGTTSVHSNLAKYTVKRP